MAERKRQMHLGVFVLGTGNHSAGWRTKARSTSSCSFPVMKTIARTAERGKFDLFFISDGVAMDPGDHPSFANRFEPLTLLAALSTVTTHVGLGATVSTSFGEPYHVARAFASLDHLSNGRAGWNVVTSTHDKAALNFSKQQAQRARPALRDRERIRRRRARSVGFLGRRRGRRRQGDRRLPRQVEDPAARSQGAVLSGEGTAQHRAVAARPSDHHPGRRLGARAGAVGPLGRPGVLRGQRRQGVGQGRLRQPEAARRQARPGAARTADPARA